MNIYVCDAPLDISRNLLRQLYLEQKLSSTVIARRLSCNPTTVSNYLRRYGLAIRGPKEAHRLQVFTKFPGRILYRKRDFDGPPAQKAYLVGFRLGDLHVTTVSAGPYCQTIQIHCRTTKLVQARLFRKLFSGYGHLYECKPDQRGAFGLRYYVNRSFDFLLPKHDRVETWIQNDPTCAIAFAAGYIDAEGSFFVTTLKNGAEKSCFAVASQDRNILGWLYRWLRSIGVICAPPKLSIRKDTPRPLRLNKDHWILQVGRKDSLLKLISVIKPWLLHPKRREDMERVIHNIRKRNASPNLKFARLTHRGWVSNLLL